MNNQDDLQPINRNYIIFGTIFIVIFSFVVYGLLSRNQNQQSKPITSTQPSTANGNGNQSNLIKYDEDSDGDKIPNFMEEFLGSNVYASEISECEKTNLTCQESPLNTIHNINIILDASTSMNILGNKNSKIQEVRNNMKFTITSELTAPYYKTSIYSFGNRGTT